MASVRVAVLHAAQHLAREAAHAGGDPAGGCEVPAEAIDRLQRAASLADRPVWTLRWAWRSQIQRYVDSRGHVDGLAAMYLLATLLRADTEAARAGGTRSPER
ncbi:MAG TPA: hypothetical protein VK875_07390 [Euzebyales bacterium]|nr:hypothetical protein [Euzebyales bacterium]